MSAQEPKLVAASRRVRGLLELALIGVTDRLLAGLGDREAEEGGLHFGRHVILAVERRHDGQGGGAVLDAGSG